MSVQTLKVAGRDFVLIPKREFDQMQSRLKALIAEERGDIAEAKRRAKQPSISIADVRKRLGR
jgi:DnaJ-domain-containing protein 1